MQDFLNQYPLLAIIPLFILLWCAVIFLIAALSGWMDLASRFHLTSTFTGSAWRLQRARMRWTSHYGSCLTVGADMTGLNLATLFLFRVGYPPLLIPWRAQTGQWKRSTSTRQNVWNPRRGNPEMCKSQG